MIMTDAQLDAAYAAINGGTPIFELARTLGIDARAGEIRQQLIQKYGKEEILTIIREKIQPNLTPEKRLKMMAKRIIEANPEKSEQIKEELRMYLDTL